MIIIDKKELVFFFSAGARYMVTNSTRGKDGAPKKRENDEEKKERGVKLRGEMKC